MASELQAGAARCVITPRLGAHMQGYFNVVPQGRAGVWAVDREGRPQSGHTYWKGFKRGTALGLTLEHRAPVAERSPGQ